MTKEQKLTKQVEEQQEKLNKLSTRISVLTDRIHALESNTEVFKGMVVKDIKMVVDGVTKLSEIVKKEKTF